MNNKFSAVLFKIFISINNCFIQEMFAQNITTEEEEFNATEMLIAKNVLLTFHMKATNVSLNFKLYD